MWPLIDSFIFTYLKVRILDELVHVIKIHASILVLEVGSEGEHDMVGNGSIGFLIDLLDKILSLNINIVIIQVRIILMQKTTTTTTTCHSYPSTHIVTFG